MTAVGLFGPEVVLNGKILTPLAMAATSITVKNTDGTAATLYTDATGATSTGTNVATTDSRGQLSFYAVPGYYDLAFTDSVGSQTLRVNVPDPMLTYANVKAFGAKGDGTTNDTTAIQAAITAVSSAGGGTVFLPTGTFITNAALTVPNNVWVRGAGWGSIVKNTAASGVVFRNDNLVAGNSNIALSDFQIDAQSSLKSSLDQDSAIWLYGVSNFIVRNLLIVNAKSDAIDLRVSTTGSTPSSGLIEGNTASSIGRNAVSIEGGFDVRVIGNRFSTIGYTGIDVEGGTATDIAIIGNHITGFGASGINATEAAATTWTIKSLSITGNTITSPSSSCPFSYQAGISVTSLSATEPFNDITIHGNTVANINPTGAVNAYGIYVANSTYITGAVVSGNTVNNVSGGGTFSTGLYISAAKSSVTGNTVTTTAYGLNVDVPNVQVTGNVIVSTTAIGLQLYASTSSVLAGNLIVGSAGTAISVTTGSNNSVVNDNAITGAFTTGILVSGNANVNVVGNNITGPTTPLSFAASNGRAMQNTGYNPVGHAVTQPAVPATTVAQTNTTGVDCTVFVNGGTVTAVAIGGTATGQIAGAFRVPAGQTITLTYTVAPTWQWFGD